MDDIEDIVSKGTSPDDIQHKPKKHVVARARKHKNGKSQLTEDVHADSHIPGTYFTNIEAS